jgi:hypothetical protein
MWGPEKHLGEEVEPDRVRLYKPNRSAFFLPKCFVDPRPGDWSSRGAFYVCTI